MSRKVLIFTSEFPPGPGGIGNHAYSLALHLTLKGYEVLVLSDFRDMRNRNDLEWDVNQPFSVVRVSNKKPRVLTYVERLTKLNWIINQFKPDAIIASGKFSLLFTPFILNIRNKPPLSFVVVHGSELYGKKLKKTWLRKSISLFDRVTSVSSHTAKILREQLGYNGKVEIIPNGILVERFEKYNSCDSFSLKGKPALLTVGSISKRKGQHNVVNALPAIMDKFPDVMYHVVGLTRDDAIFLKSIEKNGVQHKVIVHGAVEDKILTCFYKSADVFVMLSETTEEGDTEGFGIAILEANYFGKPAIGAKGCGIEDAIKDGITGRIVDPHDPLEIQNALADIMDNHKTYSENARKWAEKHKWNKVIEKYISLIEA